MSECTIEGCPNAAVAKGLCPQHYMRVRRTGSATAPPAKPGPKPKKPPGNGIDAVKLGALQAEIARLTAENAALRQQAPKAAPRPVLRPRPAAPQLAPAPDDASITTQIEALTRRLALWQRRARHAEAVLRAFNRPGEEPKLTLIERRDWRKLQMVIQRDSNPSENVQTEAGQIFNALKWTIIG